MSDLYTTLDKNLYKIESTDPVTATPTDDLETQDKDLAYVGGRMVTVPLGGNIQAAIDTMLAAGGGDVRLLAGTYKLSGSITMRSGVSLIGAGLATILDFQGAAYGILAVGTSSRYLDGFSLQRLTVKNAGLTGAAMDLDYAKNWNVENVYFDNPTNSGMRVTRSRNFSVRDVTVYSAGADGFLITTLTALTEDNVADVTRQFVFNNCVADSCTAKGFHVLNDGVGLIGIGGTIYVQSIRDGQFIGCQALDNGSHGFYTEKFAGTENSSTRLTFAYCSMSQNSGNGVNETLDDNVWIGAYGLLTGLDDLFDISGNNNLIIACRGDINIEDATWQFLVTGAGNVLVANEFAAAFEVSIAEDNIVIANGNEGPQHHREIREVVSYTGTVNAGEVVVLAPDARGNRVRTTTTAGDPKVIGMMLTTTSGTARCLLEGRTALLKVNGTTDIAIGDLLTTFTVAGIAAKASVGQVAFAMALEAYTANDSLGVIDALLITPRVA
jgi:hypothetical protein